MAKKNQYIPGYAIDLFKGKQNNNDWLEQKRKIPRNIRYGLLDTKTEELVKAFTEKYRMNNAEKTGSLAVLIREYLAGLLGEDQLKKEVYQRFGFDNLTTQNFLKEFKSLIERIKEIGIKSVKEDLMVFRFSELLEKIPEIENQEIGVLDICFPGEDQGVAPSIKNWITDYKLRRNETQKTTILNVGDYLYNSKNAQGLDREEKEQLSMILNAYEKNSIVYYNTLFEQIDFEIIDLLNKNKRLKQQQKADLGVNITKFESKPYHDVDEKTEKEKEKNEKIPVFKSKPTTKIEKENIFPKTDLNKSRNVLDLNNYV